MISIWKWPLFYQTMSPRLAIQPQVHPGNCFAFSGSAGNLAVKLSRPITIQNVTIEHIPQVIQILFLDPLVQERTKKFVFAFFSILTGILKHTILFIPL